jgi:quercetin dioxygenase-like cupin family protein
MQIAKDKEALVVRPGDVETLQVLGAGVRFLCEAEHTGGLFSVMDNELPYGAGPSPHRHDWAEGYYILSGAVDFEIDGQGVRAEAGTFLITPPGAVHTFRGADEAGSRLLVIDAPAHAAGFFRAVDREIAGPQDFPRVPAIGEAHGIHFAAA